MAKTKQIPREPTITGMYQVPLPWKLPVVRTAQDGRGYEPGIYGMHTGQNWLLLYLHSPTRIKVGRVGATWTLCPRGTAVLIPYYADYFVDTRTKDKTTEIHHTWAVMQQLEMGPIMAMMQNTTGMARFVDSQGVLARQLDALVQVGEQLKYEAYWPMQYALRPLLRSLERAKPLERGLFEVSAQPSTTLAETLVPGVVAYLQARLGGGVDTASLAKHLRLSVSTVSHSYRKTTGETPMQTLRRLRMQTLKARLVEGWTLDAAAHEVGFYDSHHASREFKKCEGITPTGFMSLVRNTAA